MTRDELARIALRYDTALSRAMLRALGVPVPPRPPMEGVIVWVDRYRGWERAMRQRFGVKP